MLDYRLMTIGDYEAAYDLWIKCGNGLNNKDDSYGDEPYYVYRENYYYYNDGNNSYINSYYVYSLNNGKCILDYSFIATYSTTSKNQEIEIEFGLSNTTDVLEGDIQSCVTPATSGGYTRSRPGRRGAWCPRDRSSWPPRYSRRPGTRWRGRRRNDRYLRTPRGCRSVSV